MSFSAQVRDTVSVHVRRLKVTAHCIAELDALCSAEVADRNNYVNQGLRRGIIEIKEGRHPVVERRLPKTLRSQRYLARYRGQQDLHHYRAEYGGKIYLCAK